MKDEKNLRQKKGIMYIDSSKAGVKFRTKTLDARNLEYLDILKKYDLQQQGVIDGIIGIVAGYVPHFQILGEKVSTLDCIVSFATAALTASPIPYVKPSLNDRGKIELKQCRDGFNCQFYRIWIGAGFHKMFILIIDKLAKI